MQVQSNVEVGARLSPCMFLVDLSYRRAYILPYPLKPPAAGMPTHMDPTHGPYQDGTRFETGQQHMCSGAQLCCSCTVTCKQSQIEPAQELENHTRKALQTQPYPTAGGWCACSLRPYTTLHARWGPNQDRLYVTQQQNHQAALPSSTTESRISAIPVSARPPPLLRVLLPVLLLLRRRRLGTLPVLQLPAKLLLLLFTLAITFQQLPVKLLQFQIFCTACTACTPRPGSTIPWQLQPVHVPGLWISQLTPLNPRSLSQGFGIPQEGGKE
mmetsp:Transcript_36413/g.81031  ORF Transcript_36413/g.81031 Transcript_36413/m.81031 type:complete len:270 (+) Transcript_36413:251-1060(+)